MKLKDKMTTAAMLMIAGAFSVVMVGNVAGTDVELDNGYEPQADVGQAITLDYRESWTQAESKTKAVPMAVTEPEEPEEVAEEPAEPDKQYTYYDVPLDDDLQEYAQDLCEQYEFPYYDIIVAMIGHESNYREDVVSATNDYGYMQINICNHEWLAEEIEAVNMLDGRQNIHSGIYIMQEFYHKYDDIGLALMCYNCGEGGAKKLWAQGIYSTGYSRQVQQEATELVTRGA